MTFSLWLTLASACLLISLTPGAGAVNTMSNALKAGFTRSIWGIIGQQIALVIHVVIVALGVGVLVQQSPLAFNIIRYAGAAYLVYLGLRQLLSRPAPASDSAEPPAPDVSAWGMLRQGLWVNLLNPKAIVFFLAFLPQFIRPEQPLVPQYVIVAVTSVVIDVLVMWFFFALAARSVRRFTASPQGQKVLSRSFGSLFILLGCGLALVH